MNFLSFPGPGLGTIFISFFTGFLIFMLYLSNYFFKLHFGGKIKSIIIFSVSLIFTNKLILL
jgi:1,4-dihydroxy-2-naphthoate octaprenyltransferase